MAPTKVEVELKDSNMSYTYDKATRKLTAQKEAVLNEEGTVTKNAYDINSGGNKQNSFKIKITYPLEAYEAIGSDTIESRMEVKAHYEGFNNQNEEFSNPYVSNIVRKTIIVTLRKPEGKVAIFTVTVGKHVYTPSSKYIVSKKLPISIYNGTLLENKEDSAE